MSKKIAQVARFKRLKVAWILCFRLLLGLLPRGLSPPRCHGPAHHMVCDGIVYQYMLLYVVDWCMSLRPTQLGKLSLQRDGHTQKSRKFRADSSLLSMELLAFRNRNALRVFPAVTSGLPRASSFINANDH